MINTCRESLSDLTPAENHNQTVLQKKADMEELEQLERTIVSGLETFKAVGLSLSEIHNRRLYKLRGFSDFGEYCEVQFKMSRSHGYRQLSHIVTCQSIGEDPLCIPEKVTRPLSRIKDPQTAQMLWQEAKAERGGQIPTSGEMKRYVELYRNNVRIKDLPAGAETDSSAAQDETPSAEAGLFHQYYEGGTSPEPPPEGLLQSEVVFCKTFNKELSKQNIAQELIAEAANQPTPDTEAAAARTINMQLNQLSEAACELRVHLNRSQRDTIKAEYQRLAGVFLEICMNAPADADNE